MAAAAVAAGCLLPAVKDAEAVVIVAADLCPVAAAAVAVAEVAGC